MNTLLNPSQSAYETLYALLESAFPRLDIPAFFDRITDGIADEHDVRILCLLMLTKLIKLAPDETQTRLPELSTVFRKIVQAKPKENAVKQEIERMAEASKGVVKASILLNKEFGADAAAAASEEAKKGPWAVYWEWVRKEHAPLVKSAEEELRDKER